MQKNENKSKIQPRRLIEWNGINYTLHTQKKTVTCTDLHRAILYLRRK